MTTPASQNPLKALWLAVLPLCLFGYMLIPRSLLPAGEPVLSLDAAKTAAQIEQDIQLAAKASKKETAQTLRALFLEAGRADLHRTQGLAQFEQRRAKMAELLAQLRQEQGVEAVDALRAEATRALAAILSNPQALTDEDTKARLGAFGNQLAVHHATRDGEPVAPMLVIYAMYKARWNHLNGQPLDLGFSPIEAQAYFGWKAMHAHTLPVQDRLDALVPYQKAGGRDVDEIAGLLLITGNAVQAARPAFEHADTQRPSLRTRNYIAYIKQASSRAD